MKKSILQQTRLCIVLLGFCLLFLANPHDTFAQYRRSNISGHIRTESGQPIPGVEMIAWDNTQGVTDANGHYEIEIWTSQFGTFVTPEKDGWTFSPVSRGYTGGSYTDQDYIGYYGGHSDPWIHVIYPNGGETWYVGNQYNIAWEADQYVGQVKLEISSDGGQNWWELHGALPNNGRCIFIPNQASDNCLIRITSVENPTARDQSDAPFAILDNITVNGDFSSGMDHWFFYVDAPASATARTTEGVLAAAIENGGNEIWHVRLKQGDLKFEQEKRYRITFDAWASAPRDINVWTRHDQSPFTRHCADHIISLSTSKQSYSFAFLMHNQTDEQARIQFDLGGSNANVFLDNIIIAEDESSGFWADVDNDEDVDVIDIQLVASRWNTRQGDSRYDPKYDVDNDGAGDGDIDVIDIQLVAAWWNKPLP